MNPPRGPGTGLARLPALAWEAVLLEVALYRSLARWLTRRPDVPSGATPIGYAKLVNPVMGLWIFASATEVVVVELVLRNLDAAWAEALRLPLLVVGVWGVLWMLGLMAAYQVRPHLLTADRLRIRNSARTWVDVPLGLLAGAQIAEHALPGVVRAVHHDDGLLLIGVSSRTNLELALGGPSALSTSRGLMTADRVGLVAVLRASAARDQTG
jgi:hypothetical protein